MSFRVQRKQVSLSVQLSYELFFFSVFLTDDNEEKDVDMKEDSDGVNAATVHSPASEEAAEVCKDEESVKDDNITKVSEVTDHAVCDQDNPNGQENDSMKNEMKIEAESQSSYMETEEFSSNQKDATIVEQLEVIPLTGDQEEKGEKAQGEDTPRVSVKTNGSCDTESSTSPDVEMNSQVDSVNDPTESQQD
ncbi:ADP-ribose glycohydrolase MACROD2-like [Glossophaga mutica]